MKIRIKNLELRIKLFMPLFLILTALFLPYPVHADCIEDAGVKIKDCFGFGEFTSLGQATSKLIPAIFSIASTLVVIYFLWGAFRYIQAREDKELLVTARQMIFHSIIGFIILIFAFLILPFLLSSLFDITGFRIF